MLEVIASLIKSIMFWLLMELIAQREKKLYIDVGAVGLIVILTIVQLGFTSDKYTYMSNLLPILVMVILGGYECWKRSSKKIIFTLVMDVYVIFVFCGFIIGCAFGLYDSLMRKESSISDKVLVMIIMRVAMIIFIWKKYAWFQKRIQNITRYIMAILGAFLLFFQQLFFIALGNRDILYLRILILLVYFTMFYTALMNLQHHHLTADNQRILDDNQRMSQEIHRSRDVIDVVSRVVATEDTIDPKLRQELADFCKSEKQEMFDPDLAASLIGDTGMDLLNVLLRDKLCQCRQQEISFEVMIPGPIDTYVSDIGIGEAELLRVINDLVKNAVTAINKTDGEVREILLILAVGPSDCLELCVYDSGVPFPDFILERFGERGNTTTGTGNGLADTVNTLRTYDASIEIDAIEPGTDIYTKCVRICFDGKNEIHV